MALSQPSWIPPAGVFGPAWGILYTLQGVAAHRVWAAGGGLGLYIVQLALNLAWQPLFFKAHDLRAASIDITGAPRTGLCGEGVHPLASADQPEAAGRTRCSSRIAAPASYVSTCAALLGVLVATVVQFRRVDGLAGKLMLPYLAFSAFAAAMTYSVTARNGAHVD